MNVIHCAATHRSSSMSSAKKLVYPAADRNKQPILEVLRRHVRRSPEEQLLLEISSGSGQHVAHFAPHFPQVRFYPSECDARLLDSIAAYCQGLANVAAPVHIDVTTDCRSWPVFREAGFDYLYNSNLVHISPYRCSEGLFSNAGVLLKSGGTMFTYGPYAVDGVLAPDSNLRFDQNLRSQDPEWGVRDISDLKQIAKHSGIFLAETVEMPANNKILIWKKL